MVPPFPPLPPASVHRQDIYLDSLKHTSFSHPHCHQPSPNLDWWQQFQTLPYLLSFSHFPHISQNHLLKCKSDDNLCPTKTSTALAASEGLCRLEGLFRITDLILCKQLLKNEQRKDWRGYRGWRKPQTTLNKIYCSLWLENTSMG